MKPFFPLLFLFFFFNDLAAQNPNYTQEEVIYGRKDGMALTMIQLKPGTNSNGKAIIKVVSGNWVSSLRRMPDYMAEQAFAVKKGYTVFLVLHGSQPRYAIPDQVADIKRAVRFIRFNAREYGIDPLHIGITGSSSGGNLALLVATADEKIDTAAKDPADRVSARVQAVAVYYPPTDFFNWGQRDFSFHKNESLLTISKVAGAFDFRVLNDTTTMYVPVTDQEARKKIYKDISPIYFVSPDDPPVLIIHGDKDRVVPLQQSESLITKFRETKVPNNLIVKKGEGHGWKNDESENKQFVEWFDKYLK